MQPDWIGGDRLIGEDAIGLDLAATDRSIGDSCASMEAPPLSISTSKDRDGG
jgi:hypothetical protein